MIGFERCVVRSGEDVEFSGLHNHSGLSPREGRRREHPDAAAIERSRTCPRNRDRSGDIHRDRDATIVIRVEPTLPLNRLPEAVEVAAYYVVSEALTNVTKYARASVVHVEVEAGDRILRVAVRDDGLGGADLPSVPDSLV